MPPAMARPRLRCSGLSLVEVLVAVGLCAVAVLATVALFGPALEGAREAESRRAALRLADAVDGELRRAGYEAVAGAVDAEPGLVLWASADGARVVRREDADNDPATGVPAGLAPAARHFLVEVRRATRPESSAAMLALAVTISWPFATPPEGRETLVTQRSTFVCHTVLNR